MDEPDVFHRVATSFAGVAATQTWADFLLWELLLNDRRDLSAIIELGTWQGGFARYLGAQARERGLAFRTYDAVVPPDPPEDFVRLDVLAYPDEVVAYMLDHEPTVLFCDNGNKPRELETFAPYVSERGLIVVHDWLTEVQPADVPDSLSPVYEEVCDELGSMSRVFEAAR